MIGSISVAVDVSMSGNLSPEITIYIHQNEYPDLFFLSTMEYLQVGSMSKYAKYWFIYFLCYQSLSRKEIRKKS